MIDVREVDHLAKRWSDRLETGSYRPLVAEASGDLSGFLLFGPSRDDDARIGAAEIVALYVDPARWRHGSGKALWETSRARMGSSGFREVTLWVLAGNVRARRFYERVGFKSEEGVTKEFRGPDFALAEVRYQQVL